MTLIWRNLPEYELNNILYLKKIATLFKYGKNL